MVWELCILGGSTIIAVLFPWFAPILGVSMYRVIDLGIHPLAILMITASAATLTTAAIWYLNNRLHTIFDKQRKNLPNEKSRTRRVRRRFDQTFTVINNPFILFCAITIGSASFIPDFFLVEFGRIKMKVKPFLLAIFCGKVLTYLLLLYGLGLVESFLHLMQ